jgi:N-acyl homoserine lactone hydrolase
MRIHPIQTGTVAIKQSQRERISGGGIPLLTVLRDPHWTEPLPIFAWLVEHPEGLLVVDTGETAQIAQPGYFTRWHPYFKFGVQEWVKPEEEIGPQMRQMGLSPDDVRWVVLTHFHTDHAGGLYHFPKAEFLVTRSEFEAARGFRGRTRGYLSQHWPDWFAPSMVTFAPTPLGTFPQHYTLTQSGNVHLVQTPGHTVGHMSVIVQEDAQDVFLAGDASYTEAIMQRQTVDGVSPDVAQAAETLRRILHYTQERPTVYLPTHDPDSAARLAARRITAQHARPVLEEVFA